MVLTVDEFIGEARVAGVPETKLAHIDPLQFKTWIEKGIRARNAAIGAEAGVPYAEAFRYECAEAPAIFKASE